MSEIVLHHRRRGGKRRQADNRVHTEQDDGKDEQRFPLQIRIHGQKVLTAWRLRTVRVALRSLVRFSVIGRRADLFRIFR